MSISLNQHQSQPAGLYILSFAELWDRFSYYGIQAMLVLYVTKIFLFSDDKAYGLYGAFTALAFATTVIGGILADRLLGFRYSVVMGALLIIIANILLVFDGQQMMYLGLSLMICGIGLFKPNNASFVGLLYSQHDPRREAGFSIFYISMNAGALLGPLVYGYIAVRYGWHLGFVIGAVGMIVAIFIFFLKGKYFNDIKEDIDFKKNPLYLFYCFLLVTVGLFDVLMQHTYLFGNLLAVTGIMTVLGLLLLMARLETPERFRVSGLCLLSFFCIFFFACSLQTGSSLTLFIERNIDRHIFGIQIPTMMFLSLEPFFIILTAPLVGYFWTWLGHKNCNPAASTKVGLGLCLAAISFLVFSIAATIAPHHHLPLLGVIVGNLILGLGELCVLPVVISAITQFAPHNLRGTLMGILFLALAFSGYLSGVIAKMISDKNVMQNNQANLINYAHAFVQVCYVTLVISLLLFCINPWLKRLLYYKPVPSA